MSRLAPEEVRTRADLGRELAALRARSGLTFRQLARQVDAPVTTLSDYFGGRHLPGPSQLGLYRAILAACGVTDPGEVETWIDALSRARFASDGRAPKTTAPYRGLEPFREADDELFFGRRAATCALLERLQALAADPGPSHGLLLLVGASGSGKSSLLAAGIVPAIRAGALDGPAVVGCTLVSGAAAGLAALDEPTSGRGPAGRAEVLIIDQFEEVLALPADSEERRRILDRLARPPSRWRSVIAALRADFYPAAVSEPSLLPALSHAQVLLAPMTEEELREAIVEPARQVGATVEEALVELVLADLAPRSPTGFAHDAGALPFLSHVLLATWERAPRNELTVADYLAASGIKGAVSQTAEEVFGRLTPAEQELTRRILARLVRVNGDSPVTRRRAERSELDGLQDGTGSPADIDTVLERFVSARLLTAEATTISISHDALLSGWPRLRGWIDADRTGLRLHLQLSDAAHAWVAAGRDESLLWRGSRLDLAAGWMAEPDQHDQLNRAEREFLAESAAQRDAQQSAARRRARRMKQLLATVGAMGVAVSVLAAFALQARANANRARDQALSRQIAIEAQQLRSTQPTLSAQLALSAYHVSPTLQARSTLIDASSTDIPTRILGPAGPVYPAVGSDGRLLALAHNSSGTVDLYSLVGRRYKPLSRVRGRPAGTDLYTVALSPDGRLLATGGTGHAVDLWDVSDPSRPLRLAPLTGPSGRVYSVAFDPSGRQLAAADGDGHVYQWDLSRPADPVAEPAVAAPGGASMHAVAYSPGGRLVVAGGDGGTLITWPPGESTPTVVAGAGTDAIETLAFSPDGSTVVTGGNDDLVRPFHVGTGGALTLARTLTLAHAPLGGPTSGILSSAFSPGGHTVAVGSADGSVQMYSTATWTAGVPLQQANPVAGLAFAPDGRTLITGDSDGTTRLWPLPAPGAYHQKGTIYYIFYFDGGKRIADLTGGNQGHVTFWDGTDPLRPTRIASYAAPAGFGPLEGAAISPNGRLMAVSNDAAQIQLIDISDLNRPRPVSGVLAGSKPYVEQISFSPDGAVMAICDDSGQIRLWDIRDPSHPVPLPTLGGVAGQILGIAFAPDGRLLASAGADDKVRLYDVADPAHPRLLATLGGFADYAYATAFTPDGRTLIAGSADHTVRLWDVTDPQRPRTLGPPLTGPNGYIYQLAVSPDGRTLAASTTDHAVWLWNIADPARARVLATLSAAKHEVFAVAISPSGGVVAAGGTDATVHFWDYRPAAAAATVCAAGGQGITAAEWSQYVPGDRYSPPCS